MYLEMLSEFSSYSCIESLLKQLVTQFLQHAGLRTSRDNTPRHSAEKHKKKKSSNTSSVYLAHTPSITSSASSMVSSRPLQQEMTSRKETNFVTWWDSDAQKLVYLDSGTGNTYVRDFSKVNESNSLLDSVLYRIPTMKFVQTKSIDPI